MTGNSWLAISQWFAAAEQPEHLAAIAPWEGFSDLHRDVICWGGIPALQFSNKLSMYFRLRPGAAAEDFGSMLRAHPHANSYWEKEKRPGFNRIEVPLYAVASWSSNLHPYGTFRAWKLAASQQKWLRVHNTQEWPDLHTPKYRDDLRAFFDYFLKEEDNGWAETPRVRVSLLDMTGPDRVDVALGDFPPPETTITRLHLDAADHVLGYSAPATQATATHHAEDTPGSSQFRIRVDEDLAICGYIKARLFVSTTAGDDMDLFMYVSKADSLGIAYPPKVLGVDFHGAESRLRVSRRNVTSDVVWDYKYDTGEGQHLAPGQVVQVDVVFWPIGLTLRKGEHLVLTVAAHNVQKIEFPTPPLPTVNQGRHRIHTGGGTPSYIELPVMS
jgi:predicted acyl esterase